MSGDEPATTESEPSPRRLAEGAKHLRPLLPALILLTVLTGVLFPLLLGVCARVLFPYQARGSLISREGVVTGSDLIGQGFISPKYFHSRSSAAGDDYDSVSSGGTNLGPNNPRLAEVVQGRAATYRRINGLSDDAHLPLDAITASGSGLDPHISPANASLQIPRVAKARGLEEDAVRRLVDAHTLPRQFGVLGDSRVAVLPLNLALDRASGTTGPH